MRSRMRSFSIRGKLASIFLILASLPIISLMVFYFPASSFWNHISEVEDLYALKKETLAVEEQIKEIAVTTSDREKESINKKCEEYNTRFHEYFYTHITIQVDSISDTVWINRHLPQIAAEDKILLEMKDEWLDLRNEIHDFLRTDYSEDSVYEEFRLYKIWDQSDSTTKEVIRHRPRSKQIFSASGQLVRLRIYFLFHVIERHLTTLVEIQEDRVEESKSVMKWVGISLAIVNVIAVLLAWFTSRKQLLEHLKGIALATDKIIRGDFKENIRYQKKDEIGHIAHTINLLTNDIKKATQFIQAITAGNLDKEYETTTILGDEQNERVNLLKDSLISMREELKNLNSKESERNWAIEGQAIFAETLSRYSNDFETLVDEVTSKLVTYTKCLQGGLFVVEENEESNEEPFMSLASTYAYDRKKFVNRTVLKGEGLIGQVWQEEKLMYVTNIPKDHTRIKSALGEGDPRSLLIVPLLDSGRIFGIIELASFNELADYEIEFVVKIGESIASTLATAEVNKKTQKLLQESQGLTEKMKSQEEVMRHNLEQLQATQEEIQRREFQKENELKLYAEKLDKINREKDKLRIEMQNDIDNLKKELEHSKTDNSTIRELNDKLEELEKTVQDLNETIKIKDMRIDKMRKKLERLR